MPSTHIRNAAPRAFLFALTLGAIPLRAQAAPDDPMDSLFNGLPWRNIGPAIMGGRIDDIAVAEGKPALLYVGAATGGLFKSTNSGTTWEPVFDSQPTLSIGDVAIAPSDENVVWAGTGESNNRQSSTWGDGVYKSTDGAKTWSHMGLAATHHIARIVIDPRNPDVVYVAATGHLWGPNKERGLFKTTDGGKTWVNTLFVNEDTGMTDLVMDPRNPDTLYAAAYQRRRAPWGFVGGGPGSGLYKTTDAGKSWSRLTVGLPSGDIGRIGVDVCRSHPNVVMAVFEHAKGGMYRSEDSGKTWKKMSDFNSRPMYYSQIRIDPNNPNRVYLAALAITVSDDGGKTWTSLAMRSIHSDFHALWIDPADSNHIRAGSDAGIQWSYDRGRTWDYVNTLSLAQFYEIAFDFRKPYWVYGGLQDNGSWAGPSMTLNTQGPSNDEWTRIGGGDGFYCAVDPADWTTVYSESQNGGVQRLNQATGESRSIRPQPANGEPRYRFDWNAPIVISPHDRKKILLAGNRLFISNDRGDSWRRTEDLSTSPNRLTLPIMGSAPKKDTLSLHDGQATFGQIVTVSESPVKAGLIYTGTDDGNLQVSRDDGLTWKNLAGRAPGVPAGTYVVRVQASAAKEGRVYAAFDNHRRDDYKPYLFVSDDFGETWRPIAAGIPVGSTLHVIREHPRNADLLFAGTERGIFASLNAGQTWRKFGAPFPNVRVDDIQIHPRDNDLIVATHGRGVFILDDIAALEGLAGPQGSGGPRLFTPRTATNYRIAFTKGSAGDKVFRAPNGPNGALLQYYIPAEPKSGEEVKLEILERDGRKVITQVRPATRKTGLNRVLWNLRTTPAGGTAAGGPGGAGGARIGPRAAGAAQEPGAAPLAGGAVPVESGQTAAPAGAGQGAPGARSAVAAREPGRAAGAPAGAAAGAAGGARAGGGGFPGGGRFLGGGGPAVLPGAYLARLTVGSEQATVPLRVEEDPRIRMSYGQLKQRYALVMKLMRAAAALQQARRELDALKTQVDGLKAAEGFKSCSASVKEGVTALEKRLASIQIQVKLPTFRGAGAGGGVGASEEELGGGPNIVQRPLAARVLQAMSAIEAITEPPSSALRTEAEAAAREVEQIARALNGIYDSQFVSLNRELAGAKLTPLKYGGRITGQ